MKGDVEVSVTLEKDDGTKLSLLVECSVSGRYRPAVIFADPDNCHEAEAPEVEAVAAKIAATESAEGAEAIHDPALDLDLKTLSAAESSRLNADVYRKAVDTVADREQSAREDYESSRERDDF